MKKIIYLLVAGAIAFLPLSEVAAGGYKQHRYKKIKTNWHHGHGMLFGNPHWREHMRLHRRIDTKLRDLQEQIDAIELVEGPAGPAGPMGEPGPAGPPGEGGADRLARLNGYFGENEFLARFPRSGFDSASCAVGGGMTVTVGATQTEAVGFIGRDGISRPAHYFVALRSANPLDAAGMLGATASVAITSHAVFASFGGEVTRAGLAAVEGGAFVYALEIRPPLDRLRRNRGYRILQDLNTLQAVQDVLGANGIAFNWLANSEGLARETITQYDETDLHFVSRLLESDGFHYYVDDSGAMQVRDNAGGNPSAGALDYDGHFPAVQSSSQALAFNAARAIPGDVFGVSSFDFRFGNETFEASASAGGAGSDRRFAFGESSDGVDLQARINRDASLTDASRFRGVSNNPALRAGKLVSLNGAGGALDGDYFVTAVDHAAVEGDDGCVRYLNRFDATAETTRYRPPRLTPKPLARGITTAIVTGPSGEEIYTDEFGRIKVSFHWDRDGSDDETSSAWIRVAQMHRGADAASVFLPRVGDEVVVAFVDGDPDRPLALGRLFNAQTPPPVALPDEKASTR